MAVASGPSASGALRGDLFDVTGEPGENPGGPHRIKGEQPDRRADRPGHRLIGGDPRGLNWRAPGCRGGRPEHDSMMRPAPALRRPHRQGHPSARVGLFANAWSVRGVSLTANFPTALPATAGTCRSRPARPRELGLGPSGELREPWRVRPGDPRRPQQRPPLPPRRSRCAGAGVRASASASSSAQNRSSRTAAAPSAPRSPLTGERAPGILHSALRPPSPPASLAPSRLSVLPGSCASPTFSPLSVLSRNWARAPTAAPAHAAAASAAVTSPAVRSRPRRNASRVCRSVTLPAVTAGSTPPE